MNTKIISILFILIVTSCKQNHIQQISNQQLADKTAITDLLVRYSYAVDFRDWNSYEQVFTKDAIIDYRAFWRAPDKFTGNHGLPEKSINPHRELAAHDIYHINRYQRRYGLGAQYLPLSHGAEIERWKNTCFLLRPLV